MFGQMCSYWPEINRAIEKRNKKVRFLNYFDRRGRHMLKYPYQQLLDYDSARTKSRKLVEKPSEDSSKLPLAERQTEEAKESAYRLHIQLALTPIKSHADHLITLSGSL